MNRRNVQSLEGLRVLMVLATLDLGGAERQALLLAEYLREVCGCEVAVAGLFGGTGKQAVRRMCREKRIPCMRFSMPEMMADGGGATAESVEQFGRELSFLKPDVVLPYTALPNILCGLTWRKAGVGACIWGQRDLGTGEEEWRQWGEAVGNVRHFAVNSEAGAAFLVGPCGVMPERVSLIANGIKRAPEVCRRMEWRREIGVADDDFVAGMVGNIQPRKDHRTLLLAWREVVARAEAARRRAILCLAGELTASAAALQGFAQDIGIAESVRWLGAVEDVSGFLSAMDLAVFSSVEEGLPNGILESMAAGLAVVATDNSGSRQALGQERGECFARAGDAGSLATRMLWMMHAPELRQQIGRENKERVQQRFSVEAMGGAYERLIRACLHRPLRIGPARGIAWASEGRKSVL